MRKRKPETFESGDQSGDLKNGDNKNACFLRVNTEKRKRYSLVNPLSRDFAGKMDEEVVTVLLVFISNLLAVYQLNLYLVLLMELSYD